MKKVVLNFLVIAAFAGVAAFTSCIEEEPTFTVTFDSNGGSEVPSQTVKEGGKVSKPIDPTREDEGIFRYNFAGWAIAPTNNNYLWNFETDIVEKDMTLYARWGFTIIDDGGGKGFKITGTVENGSKYNGRIVNLKVMVTNYDPPVAISTGGNWSNGGFSIDFPETVNASHLGMSTVDLPSNYTVSNRNVRYGAGFVIAGFDNSDNMVSYFI